MIENCHKNGLACDDNFPCKSVFGYLITEREKGLYEKIRPWNTRAFRWGGGYRRTVILYLGMMVSLVMIVRFLDCA